MAGKQSEVKLAADYLTQTKINSERNVYCLFWPASRMDLAGAGEKQELLPWAKKAH